jgi:AGZA family xanthine/uracil permease-like MFS transporter
MVESFLERVFCIRARGSTIATEIRAGLTTFMTMAYILVVNPTVLSGAGLPFAAVAFATAMTAIVGSTIAGAFGNLPFGLAPGMGLNAYFAYGVCVAKGFTPMVALTIVFAMGVIFGVLSAVGACSLLQKVMPDNLKHATTVAIGVFQAFIGFRMVDIVVRDEHTLVALGDITSPKVALSIATTFLIGILVIHRVPGAMLVGIAASSVVSWASGLHPLPTTFVEVPTVQFLWNDLAWEETFDRWDETLPVLFAFLFVCIFDTAGVQFGAGLQAGLIDEKSGELPGTTAAFLASAIATALGGLLGTSPTIIHNETCAGIAEGGRTGLVALVVSVMFGLSVFFVPIFAAVPLTATAPALIIVGAFMMGPAGAMDWDNFNHSLPAFLTISTMPLTYSIANGVVAGLVSHVVLESFTTPALWLALQGCAASLTGRFSREGNPSGLREPLHASDRKKRSDQPNGSPGNLSTCSASASPHSMVRNPLLVPARSNSLSGSFNGLNALGRTPTPDSTPSPSYFLPPA